MNNFCNCGREIFYEFSGECKSCYRARKKQEAIDANARCSCGNFLNYVGSSKCHNCLQLDSKSRKCACGRSKGAKSEMCSKCRAANRRPKPECSFGPCDRESKTKGLCATHYSQQRAGKTLTPIRVAKNRYVNANGYVVVIIDGEKKLEHRVVMSKILGRELLPGENVHHKNGVRSDNTPENLELWVSHQPSGQRPEDLLLWADEIIKRYRTAHEEVS